MLVAVRSAMLRQCASAGSALARNASTAAAASTTTQPGSERVNNQLDNVTTLFKHPRLLLEAVPLVLHASKAEVTEGLRVRLLTELRRNPALQDRKELFERVAATVPWKKFVFHDSHTIAIEKEMPAAKDTVAHVARIILTRYADAPFLSAQDFLGIVSTLASADERRIVIHKYLLDLADQSHRLALKWEQELLTQRGTSLAVERELIADHVRAVDMYLTNNMPDFLNEGLVRVRLMSAYAATRVAQADALRHWSWFLQEPDTVQVLVNVLAPALHAARDLDTLRAVWAQAPKTDDIKVTHLAERYYGTHLARLGAVDEAAQFIRDPEHTWTISLVKGEPGKGPMARKNMKRAEMWATNGLDLETSISLLAWTSPYFNVIRLGSRKAGIKPPPGPRTDTPPSSR